MKLQELQVYEEPLQEGSENQHEQWYTQAALASGQKIQKFDSAAQYLEAARDGDFCAGYVLGKLYFNGGFGVEQSHIKAAMWFGKAHGNPYADYALAEMCWNGIGIDQDKGSANLLYKEALREFIKLEEHSPTSETENRIAKMYENGLGTVKNKNTAQYWQNMAQDGHADIELEKPKIIPLMLQDESDSPTPEIEPTPLSVHQKLHESTNIEGHTKGSAVIQVLDKKQKKAVKRKSATKKKDKNSENIVIRNTLQSFWDMIAPSILDFAHSNYFVCGNTCRCVWAIREYSPVTSEFAILKDFGETDGITLRIFTRPVSKAEQGEIFNRAEKKNRFTLNNASNMQTETNAEDSLKDMKDVIKIVQREKENLFHCAVFIEIIGDSLNRMHELQEMVRSICANRFVLDELHLRQKEGFQTVMLTGKNQFKGQFERVLPSSSIANFYPFSYSGKTDAHGMLIGRDKHGTNLLPDFDRRTSDKTNGNVIIIGNPGQGKSYLMKIILTNLRQMQKKLYSLDPENEYGTLTEKLGGCNIDMMSGEYFINTLEPRLITDKPLPDNEKDNIAPIAYRKKTRLSQHIAYLRDFFGCYKPFSMEQLDTLEIMLKKLYDKFNITDNTDFSSLQSESYPILSDLFEMLTAQLESYEENGSQLYTKDMLRGLTLGLQSICVGSESTFFNGYTNITNADHINFVVKDLLETNENLKNAMFLNIFSFLNHKFLTEGKAVVSLDELYLFFSNTIAIKYVLSFEKRGRKKDSNIILATQNIEDLNRPNIREFTKPLLTIPSHSFIFYLGSNCDENETKRLLNLSDSEFDLIRNPQQGYCLYKSGSERYHLHVMCPEYKNALFGTAGGR